MRTFRITLSHGSESVTFDGAGARSGSMFHVRMDAIEGLWSSPASKVSLTELETANGASPISDGETLYAARTVVIPFAIQSNYNHTDLIRARILLGRLIGWHDVRMDIYDDGDETVLFGYIEAKYSDIPYDHADTGAITMVCPDPRRVSKNASTVTMNTSSNGLGGLSYGVPDYVKSWTGTPNASTSILSQDGAVVATNLVLNPKPVSTGDIYWSLGGAVSDKPNGMMLTYTTGDSTLVDIKAPVLPSTQYVIGAELVALANATELSYQGALLAYTTDANRKILNTYPENGDYHLGIHSRTITTEANAAYVILRLYCPNNALATATWRNAGVYTQSDWQAMQSLGFTWFDGDSQSPQPNAGLAFPINFGQTGNTGNTGMIVNNGSYVSTPIITANGGLDGGLTLHWNTSDGNEGDLSYKGSIQNVPVTINTDTHSAIMGGLDVSYQLGSRDWPRIPAGGSCSFALLASGNGWVTIQSHDTYM